MKLGKASTWLIIAVTVGVWIDLCIGRRLPSQDIPRIRSWNTGKARIRWKQFLTTVEAEKVTSNKALNLRYLRFNVIEANQVKKL